MNITLFWLLLVPLLLSFASVFVLPRICPRQVPMTESWIFAAVGLVISAAIIAGGFYAGKGSMTRDTEILNGEVTGKDRHHDSYTRTYDCNCRQVQTGTDKDGRPTYTQQCDTCHEEHYTVEWTVNSNIGSFRIDKLDWTSSRVYSQPNPAFFDQTKPGDPCARRHGYTNYIKAVPETLFRPAAKELKEKYAAAIPEYPLGIYNFYSINRVLPVGVTIPNPTEWNQKLSQTLKTLGPNLQANAIIVVTRFDDPNFFYALQDAWVGAKKNDIVVVIGAPEFPKKAAWVNVMALTDKEIFKIQLRDDILDLEELTADNVLNILKTNALKSYQRKRMRDFEYLDSEIDPPTWVIIITTGLVIFAYLGFWFLIWKNSFPFRRYR